MGIYKALSMHEGTILDILFGFKTEEHKVWGTDHRGDILICSIANNRYRGFVFCVVNLYECLKSGSKGNTFYFKNIRPVKPIPIRGNRGLYDIELDEEIKFINLKRDRATINFVKSSMQKSLGYKKIHPVDILIDISNEYRESYDSLLK